MDDEEEERVRRFGITMVVVMATVAVFSGGTASAQTATLKVGQPSLASDILVHVAQAKGYFAKNGVNVEIVENLGANTPNSLVAGQIDIAAYTAPSSLQIAIQGKNATVIYGINGASSGGSMFGVPGKVTTIDQVKALSTCRIATFPPGAVTYALSIVYRLKLNSKCDLVPLLDAASQIGAVQAGRADVLVGNIGNFLTAIAQKKLVPILDTRDREKAKAIFGPDYVSAAMVGIRENLQSKRDAVAKFLKALDDAGKYLQKTPDTTITDLMSRFPTFAALELKIRRSTVRSLIKYLWSYAQPGYGGYILKTDWDRALKKYRAWGLSGYDATSPTYAFDQRVDMSFYRAGIGDPTKKKTTTKKK